MKIKKLPINVKRRIFLAPMSKITDLAFRLMSLSYGAGLVTIPMISSAAVSRNNKTAFQLLKTIPEEKPKAIQLFGAKIEEIKKAAKIAVEKTNCDMIDFNMGCPMRKITIQGAGSALLNKPEHIKKIITALKSSVDIPISIKIRTGITEKQTNAVKIAKIIEKAGADMLTIHGRTVKQKYSGKADWNIIKQVKESVTIPVVGSGDISSIQEAKEKLKLCDAVMIGRAAIGKPYIFSKETKNPIQEFFNYHKLAKRFNQDKFVNIKKQALFFTKGMNNSRSIRVNMTKAKNFSELKSILKKEEENI